MNMTIKIVASPTIRKVFTTLGEIPDEPGTADLTIIHRSDWMSSYARRVRQLRYVVVSDMESVNSLLHNVGYRTNALEDNPPD